MLTIPKSVRLQSAADDAYVIGETIESLCKLLDRFVDRHGDELGRRLLEAFPSHGDINPRTAKSINDFAHSLEPPEN